MKNRIKTMYDNAEKLTGAFQKLEPRMLVTQGVIRHPVMISPGSMQAFATHEPQEMPALITVVTNQN